MTGHDENPSPGVLQQERDRIAGMTIPQREQEHWRFACSLAADHPPDREAHRAAFYARHNYDPTKED
jgi:hypothetical protein